jgi:acetylornithine deacetylase/succinyl-diaminopimelate desuccinylase-like protein
VLGPGHIEQAHVRDEWVSLDQLERCLEIYRALLEAGSGS